MRKTPQEILDVIDNFFKDHPHFEWLNRLDSTQKKYQVKYRCKDCSRIYVCRKHHFASAISHGRKVKCITCKNVKDSCMLPVVWNKLIFSQKRNSRVLEFTITKEYAEEVFRLQEGRCCYTGRVITLQDLHKKDRKGTASLDRIDSNKGYIKGNICWVYGGKDFNINLMKLSSSRVTFIRACFEVTHFINNVLAFESNKKMDWNSPINEDNKDSLQTSLLKNLGFSTKEILEIQEIKDNYSR